MFEIIKDPIHHTHIFYNYREVNYLYNIFNYSTSYRMCNKLYMLRHSNVLVHEGITERKHWVHRSVTCKWFHDSKVQSMDPMLWAQWWFIHNRRHKSPQKCGMTDIIQAKSDILVLFNSSDMTQWIHIVDNNWRVGYGVHRGQEFCFTKTSPTWLWDRKT